MISLTYCAIIVGALNENEGFRKEIPLNWIKRHPKFDINSTSFADLYDIAKIELEEPLNFNKTVGAIRIAPKKYKLKHGKEKIISHGYGVPNNNTHNKNKIARLSYCTAVYNAGINYKNYFTSKGLNFKGERFLVLYSGLNENHEYIQHIINGDSGGPVVSIENGFVIAINSGIIGTGLANLDLLTPINLYYDFLMKGKKHKNKSFLSGLCGGSKN